MLNLTLDNINVLQCLYFLIVLSVIGHGALAIRFTKTNISIEEIGFVGLVGIFFLILYSYITHFFISHSYLHNLIFSLQYHFTEVRYKNKQESNFLSLVFKTEAFDHIAGINDFV